MSENTCDRCAHYLSPYEDHVMITTDTFDHPDIRAGGICDSGKMSEDPSVNDYDFEVEKDAVYGLHCSVIWVGPKFGCIHWKKII